jgi:hypothetical protein
VSTAVKEATAAFRVPGENRACGFRVTVLLKSDLPERLANLQPMCNSQLAAACQAERQRQRAGGLGTGRAPSLSACHWTRETPSRMQPGALPAVLVPLSGSRVIRTLAGNYAASLGAGSSSLPLRGGGGGGGLTGRLRVPPGFACQCQHLMEGGPRPVRAGQPRHCQDKEACPDRQPEDAAGDGGRLLAPGWQGPQGGRVPGGAKMPSLSNRAGPPAAGPGRRSPPASPSPADRASEPESPETPTTGPSPAGTWSGDCATVCGPFCCT